jgi:hypothetical protein
MVANAGECDITGAIAKVVVPSEKGPFVIGLMGMSFTHAKREVCFGTKVNPDVLKELTPNDVCLNVDDQKDGIPVVATFLNDQKDTVFTIKPDALREIERTSLKVCLDRQLKGPTT